MNVVLKKCEAMVLTYPSKIEEQNEMWYTEHKATKPQGRKDTCKWNMN